VKLLSLVHISNSMGTLNPVEELCARASFYFYNTKTEVDVFVDVVKEIQKFFGQ